MKMRNVMVTVVGLGLMGVMLPRANAQFPTPEVTKEHKLLQKDVGAWDAVMKLWMGGPDSEPMTSQGVERSRMVGDFWVVSNYEGEIGGQKFEGHGQVGYDTTKKKFVGTWIDGMSTSLGQMEGTYDEATKELTMVMTMADPQTGQDTKSKTVTKYVDDDTRQFTMYMQTPGAGDDWVKSMEITYKRRPREGKKQRE